MSALPNPPPPLPHDEGLPALLLPDAAHPPGGRWRTRLLRAGRWSAIAAGVLLAVFVGLSLTLRYAVFPRIGDYRETLAAQLTKAVGLPVRIGAIETGWDGLRPYLGFKDVEVHDREGRPALRLAQVGTVVSWRSLAVGALRLHQLELLAPDLDLRRDGEGRIFVAGVAIERTPEEGPGFGDWLLAQDQVVVRGARLRWTDELRGAPTLVLEQVDGVLDNGLRRHRLALAADPPAGLAQRIDLRADLSGTDLATPESWQGQLYGYLRGVDLAAWRPWVAYPVALPKGQGELALWVDVAAGRPAGFTAQLGLRDVEVRARRDLAPIALKSLSGRFAGRQRDGRYEMEVQGLEMHGENGLRIAPTALSGWWRPDGAGGSSGEAAAGVLELENLARIAGALPFDAQTRRLIARHDPRGRVRDLKLAWDGNAEALKSWKLAGRFEYLGLDPQGVFPGFENLNGRVDATEKGGSLSLDSRGAALDLPRVFAEPRLAFDTLTAEVQWKALPEGLDVRFKQVEFAGRDAAGHLDGTYLAAREGPHRMDLSGRLSRAEGSAVWRYIPRVAGEHTAQWLRHAIAGARVSDVALQLRGAPLDFPYSNGNGLFRVVGKIHDGRLRYAEDWPEISGIEGDLLFEGPRMLIRGESGRVFGARVIRVSAEIPDLGADRTVVLIQGEAAGPTEEFLRFTRESPVAVAINHFTDATHARGDGSLRLNLTLPLWDLANSGIAGEYRFDGNEVSLDPDIPLMSGVHGVLAFSGDGIRIQQLAGTLLGAPFTASADTHDDGTIAIRGEGGFSVAELRRYFDLPLMEHFSGASSWKTAVHLRARGAEVVIESPLTGVSSSLPEPLNKTATAALPLRIERHIRAADGAQGLREAGLIGVSGVGSARFERRFDGQRMIWERLGIGLGERAPLPASGVAVAARVPRADLDFWREAFDLEPGAHAEGRAVFSPWPVALDIEAEEVRILERRLHDAALKAVVLPGVVQAEVDSRELNGLLRLEGGLGGVLSARLKRLTIPDPDTFGSVQAAAVERLDRLPAVSLTAERFLLRKREMGRLEVRAANLPDGWRLEHLSLRNPQAIFNGEGYWNPRANRTALKFKLDVADAGGFLDRLGYGDALRKGEATLTGELNWADAPVHIDYPSLAGAMKLEAAGGQFRKLEPGIGKLLGVLSLQALPRRITLDFRDIFSEGFAYDAISASMAVDRGILHSDDLEIRGPSAKVMMRGDVDLQQETQNLRVRVQPALGETVAVGAMLANPMVGFGAYLAQKILRDPLDRIFSFDYAVSGRWDDPKVDKIGGRPREQDDPNPQ